MENAFKSALIRRKSIQHSTDRKVLIKTLKLVIRSDRKLQRQIQRKYQVHQRLEAYRENLKDRIRQVTTTLL